MRKNVVDTPAPEVAIVVPVFNDQDHVAAALDSCLAQTLVDIEVIVVDDASTDDTPNIAAHYADMDGRVRLIRFDANATAFHARRVGINAATAPFVLFLDGDDLLVPEAAATALALARERSADVVGFGCQVIRADGSTGSRYEAGMQPKHKELLGAAIVQKLFPVGVTAQGQLWRYLFDRNLLVEAYSGLPETLRLVRVNDLPIAFLVLMRARKYVSTSRVLYRYYFQRGASGHQVSDLEAYLFNASAIDSIDAIADLVTVEADGRTEGEELRRTYGSVRLSVIGRVLDYVRKIADDGLRKHCLGLLQDRAGRSTLVHACADFCDGALSLLASDAPYVDLAGRQPRRVLLRTGNLRTGGVQGVLVAQAGYLVDAGFEVTIAIDAGIDTPFQLPAGVELIQITGGSRGERLSNFRLLCNSRDIDVIIDHHILYNDNWPYFALLSAEEGIPTIGWLHNFALRPILDGTTRTTFLEMYLRILSLTIVLSRADVAYWKLLGLERVAYLPNPESPILRSLPERPSSRPAPTGALEIVWWGRLQQSTKQVRELIAIGARLRDLGTDFRITVIGPDSNDLSAVQLHEEARARGIAGNLVTPGPMHGDELIEAISKAHVYVSTSAIEGYPLTFVEAQALGLPLVMYDLPWLATLENNAGVVVVGQGDRRGAAAALADLAADASHYTKLSDGALAAAHAARSYDFTRLYSDLVRGELASAYSPQPDIADARLLVQQYLLFAERLIRRERRALDRAYASVAKNEKKVRRLERERNHEQEGVRARETRDRKNVPSVPRTGLKGWLMSFLPATMKQSSFYARHSYNVSIEQREQILSGQAALDERLRQLDASLNALKREATNAGSGLEPLIDARFGRLEAIMMASQRSGSEGCEL